MIQYLKGLALLAFLILLLSACSLAMETTGGAGGQDQQQQQRTPTPQTQGIPDSYSQTGTGGIALYTAMQQQKCMSQDPVGGPLTVSKDIATGNHPTDEAYAIAHCPGNVYRVFLWDRLEGMQVRMSRVFTKKDRIWTLDPISNCMNWLVVLTFHSACGTTTIWVTWYSDPGQPDSIPPLIRVSGPC